MATVVVVPLKPFAEAKERLAGVLGPHERADLARVTFRTVVAAVDAAGLDLVVVTSDTAGIAGMLPPRTTVVEESGSLHGLNAQLEYALAQPACAGFTDVLILHADLPLVSAPALDDLAGRAAPATVVMVESPDGGTNALLMPLPRQFPLQYGRNSFTKHQAEASAAGLAVVSHESPSLALDLDTPGDLGLLFETSDGRSSPAGRWLSASGVLPRISQPGQRHPRR